MSGSNVSSPESPEDETTVLGVNGWCQTKVKVAKFSYTWSIHNFSLRSEKTGKALKSTSFSSGLGDNLEWCLLLYPKGGSPKDEDYLSLHLTLNSDSNSEVAAAFTLSIFNAKLKEIKSHDFVPPKLFTQKGDNWGCGKFIKLEDLFHQSNGLLPDDKLIVYCEIRIVTDSVDRSGQYKDFQFKIPGCKIWEELEQLLNTQKLSDVILSVNGHEFHAHKAILGARSQVFSDMFEHEKNLNRVEITDIDHKVVGEMLRFIYTGRAPKQEMAADLLAVADNYALDRLKVMCEEALCKTMSVDSTARALYLADKYSADQLKAYTIDFMTTHGNDLIRTLAQRRKDELTESCRSLTTREESSLENNPNP